MINKNFCIYKITNILNNKVYIGKTSANTRRRWWDHIDIVNNTLRKKQYIHNAMAKYGVNNFTFEIIKYTSTEDAAYSLEKKYIKKYNSFGEGGYNETSGGKSPGGSGRKITHEGVKNICRDYIYSDMTSIQLMDKYNLSKPCILDILYRRSYIDVKISDNLRYQIWLKLHRPSTDYDHVKNCSFTKNTEENIKNIFKDYSTGKYSLDSLSEKYKMRVGNISFIINRKTWKHVKIDERTFKKVLKIKQENKFSINQEKFKMNNTENNDQSGGILGEPPTEKWKKFFEQFPEIETLEVSKWKPLHLISYFNKKYYEAYNTKYKFKFNTPSPVKSFEVFQIKKLAMNLSSDPIILYNYINWAFKEKIEKGKRKVSSISFLTNEDFVNYYKINVLLANKADLHIDRSTPLPQNFKNLLSEIAPINTYGDLSFINQSFKFGAFDSNKTQNFNNVISKLESLGFDPGILEKIV